MPGTPLQPPASPSDEVDIAETATPPCSPARARAITTPAVHHNESGAQETGIRVRCETSCAIGSQLSEIASRKKEERAEASKLAAASSAVWQQGTRNAQVRSALPYRKYQAARRGDRSNQAGTGPQYPPVLNSAKRHVRC